MMRHFNFICLLFISALIISCGGNKAEALIKEWKATDITLGDTKLLAEDIGGVYFTFNADSSFVYTETGSTQRGNWIYNSETNTIDLIYAENNLRVTQTIQELTPEKLILNYEEHGMKRSLTLIPNTK